MDILQFLLPNGRGVRFRLLSPSEHDSAVEAAGAAVGSASDSLAGKVAMRNAQTRECIKRMLHSVTKKTGLAADDLTKPETAWVELTAQALALPGEHQYDKLFGAKEDAILSHLYTRYHELTRDEAEAIVGKVLPVSVG